MLFLKAAMEGVGDAEGSDCSCGYCDRGCSQWDCWDAARGCVPEGYSVDSRPVRGFLLLTTLLTVQAPRGLPVLGQVLGEVRGLGCPVVLHERSLRGYLLDSGVGAAPEPPQPACRTRLPGTLPLWRLPLPAAARCTGSRYRPAGGTPEAGGVGHHLRRRSSVFASEAHPKAVIRIAAATMQRGYFTFASEHTKGTARQTAF